MSAPSTTVLNEVINMANDPNATKLAGTYGLNINTVSWEDNARTKNSCWGPCISDMTLNVQDRNLPVIRSPNYTDLTWDVEIEKIPIVVGNESGGQLKTVTLKEYLSNFDKYLHTNPNKKINLLRDEDSHVIMSSQACFLPMEKEKETSFNVSIYNYQSNGGDPAVLSIVACVSGTSATTLSGKTKLYFNKNGERASFVGQRLSDNRKQRNDTNEDKEMTSEEKMQNVLFIIQVPLKQKKRMPDMIAYGSEPMLKTCCAPVRSRSMAKKSDVENVIVKIGKTEGKYTEVDGIDLVRDTQFPIRVTMQFYKATSNGVIDDEAIKEIHEQIQSSRKYATSIGSLVVGNSDRPTEHVKTQPKIPVWWNDFWNIYKSNFARFTQEAAAQIIFKDGRFNGKTMNECENDIMNIMINHPENNLPKWEF